MSCWADLYLCCHAVIHNDRWLLGWICFSVSASCHGANHSAEHGWQSLGEAGHASHDRGEATAHTFLTLKRGTPSSAKPSEALPGFLTRRLWRCWRQWSVCSCTRITPVTEFHHYFICLDTDADSHTEPLSIGQYRYQPDITNIQVNTCFSRIWYL